MSMYNPPHPGKVLKELYMEPLNVSVTTLARVLDVRRATISDIVNGNAGISPNMAIKLSQAFKTTPDLWLGMQMQYDLWQAKQTYGNKTIDVLCG